MGTGRGSAMNAAHAVIIGFTLGAALPVVESWAQYMAASYRAEAAALRNRPDLREVYRVDVRR
jgi:hypothetical protein